MRRLLFLLCLLASVLTAGASYDVVYWNTNFDSQFTPQYGQKILVSPIYFSNSIAPLQPRMYTCGAVGSTYPAGFIISNMLSGRYTFDIQSTPRSTPRIFVIPNGSGLYTLSTADVVLTAAGTGFPTYHDLTNYIAANSGSGGSATNANDVAAGVGITIVSNNAALQRTISVNPATVRLPVSAITNLLDGSNRLTNNVNADTVTARSFGATGNATFLNTGNAGAPLTVDEMNGTNVIAQFINTVSGRAVKIDSSADVTAHQFVSGGAYFTNAADGSWIRISTNIAGGPMNVVRKWELNPDGSANIGDCLFDGNGFIDFAGGISDGSIELTSGTFIGPLVGNADSATTANNAKNSTNFWGLLSGTNLPALTGDITSSAGSAATTLKTSPTIVTPTIASFANATHNHQNAAGGGTLDAAAIASGTVADARLSGNVALVTTNAFSMTASNSLPLTTNLIAPTFLLILNGAGALTNTSGTGWANIILSNATATSTNYYFTNAAWRAIGAGTTNDAPGGVLAIPAGKVAYVTVQNQYGFTAYWTTIQRTP